MTYPYINAFKALYYDNAKGGKHNLSGQVPHLVGLANHYREKNRTSQDWTDCLKVTTWVELNDTHDPLLPPNV